MDLESALSLSEKIWHKRDIDEEKIAHIAKLYDISPLLARIIVIREIDENAIPSFLTPKLRDLLPDPLTLKDMDEAVLTIAQAIKDKASIAICGDYDADGISASALLKKYFDALGVETQIHLPDRLKDGYGLNHEAIDSIQKSDCHYMISVDCGAKDIEVLDKAHQQGLNIVILDHHPTSQKPPSRAFVNPNGADCQSGLGYLTAVGVAFIFLVGLSRHLRDNYGGQFDSELPDLMSWLDLVALGTICDVAPLIGVNRAFVVRGLEALARGDNIGLKALAEKINLSFPMNVESFSFAIGPHINAAGRIGHADLAFDLLVGKDEEKAKQMAAELHLLNRQRRAIESQILNEALARMRASEENASLKAGLVLSSKNWHAGVIGIVAARVKDLYQRPAAVISEAGEQSVGSARGDGVDLGAIMEEALARDLLIKGGGHKQAAGFTISADKIPAFSDFLRKPALKKNPTRHPHARLTRYWIFLMLISAFIAICKKSPLLARAIKHLQSLLPMDVCFMLKSAKQGM